MTQVCVIFGAGEYYAGTPVVPAGAYVIAADGGLDHTRQLGIVPDVVVGAGTVLTVQQMQQSIDAGADFLVTPGTPPALADALGTIARSRGMSDIAKASGITREALYKALRPNASPRFETISKVCAALGVRLVAQPIHAHP